MSSRLPPTLELRTFGRAELRRISGYVRSRALLQPRGMALLTYLALAEPGPFHSRDTLMGLFWPNLDQEHARNALNQAIHRLRRILRSGVLLSRGRENIGLATDRLHCDAVEFRRAVRNGKLDEGLRLYRGPLLDGFFVSGAAGFERWLDEERARLQLTAFDAACRLADDALARSAADERLGWLKRALVLRPGDEETARDLVLHLAQMGDRTGAVDAHEIFVQRLREEYDLEPSPETEAAIAAALQTSEMPQQTTVPLQAAAVSSGLTPPVPLQSRRRRVLTMGALGVALLLVFAHPPTTRDSARQTTAESIARFAVPPFTVRGGDSADLGEALSFLLSANLDGAGTLRAVDPFVAESALRGAAPDHQQNDSAGTAYTVRGTAIKAGERLRLVAAIYPSAARTNAVASASVDGKESELIPLAERLASELIAAWSGEPGGELRRTAARTTHSLSALKLYLRGERARRAANLHGALNAFREAVEQDSSFALAQYRLSVAATWVPEPEVATRAGEAAVRHAGHLPERYRLLLEAKLAYEQARITEAEQRYRAILTSYPDEVEAWYGLGETLYHFNRVRGRLQSDAAGPLRRTLLLDPEHGDAIHHLLDLAVDAGRTAEHDSLTSMLRARLGRTSEAPLEMRARLAFAHGNPLGEDQAALWRELNAADDARLTIAFFSLPARPATRPFADSLLRLMKRSDRSVETRALAHMLSAHRAVIRGRFYEAFGQLDQAGALGDRVLEQRAVYLLLPFWPAAEGELQGLRAQLLAWHPIDPPHVRDPLTGIFLNIHEGVRPVLRLYLLGLVAARLRDTTQMAALTDSLAGTRRGLVDARARLADDLSRGLRAELAWLRGQPAQALAALGPLDIEEGMWLIGPSPFYSRIFNRFLSAELLRALGRRAEAVLRYATMRGLDTGVEAPFWALAELRQAQLLHDPQHPEKAAAHYARFLELWRDADPPLQSITGEGRRGLEALRAAAKR